MLAELAQAYGPLDHSATPAASPADMTPPDGIFVVLYDAAGEPLAGGGVKRLADDVAEIKRMYVAPGARSRGLARELLTALEAAARDLGYARVRLDTGPKQPHARALYESAGYASIGDYNGNRYADYWAEKSL